jgi:DNA repair protein RadD
VQLRPYQERAIDDLRAAYKRGRRAPCLVLPTGAGKTVVASAIISAAIERSRRVLFLAHRVELIDQTVAKLENAGITDVRMIRATHNLGSPTAPVTVASIPTLVGKRWRDNLPDATLVVFDECHHTVAKTWKQIADHYSDASLLGLTATPERSDGAALGDIFDEIVVGATVGELIDLGHLAKCRVQGPPVALGSHAVAMSVADAYSRYANGQRAVVFCSTVEESNRIASDLPVRAAVVHGGMSNRDRADTLGAFHRGEIRVVVNVFVLTEGWDDPGCAVAILNRNPGHAGVYLQMCGRVLRPHPDKAEALIVDLCGSTLEHGSPTMDRTFSLDGKAIDHDRKLVKQCAVCGAVFEASDIITANGLAMCPVCGCDLGFGGKQDPIVKDILGVNLEDLSRLPPRPMRPREITSQYNGRCARCHRYYSVGDSILWAKGVKATHVVCPEIGVAA